jgi:hypothetical protein
MVDRTLRVTLDIKVSELTPTQRLEMGLEDPLEGGEDEDMVSNEPVNEFEETTPRELGEIASGIFFREYIDEAFGGSNIFLTFGEKPKVVSAEWHDEAG